MKLNPGPLAPPRLVEPLRLREVERRLVTTALPRAQTSDGQRRAAEVLVRQQLANDNPLSAPAKLVPALVELYPSLGDRRARLATLSLLIHAESIGWRRLWAIWQVAGEEGRAVIPPLAHRLHRGARENERFRKRLPAWLPMDSLVALERALFDPADPVREYFEITQTPIVEWPAGTELSDAGGVGRSCLLALARRGSDRWWRLCPPGQVRSWATTKQIPALSAIVADRQLGAAFAAARGPADVRGREIELRTWILRQLGDPALHPGRWDQVSARSRQVFEWLLLADECQKIFEEFRRNARNDERAEYWERFLPRISDALYYQARDTAVCLMRFERLLVIEFGTAGNACYFYRWNEGAPPLRAVRLARTMSPADFKATNGLRLGAVQFPFIKRLTHRGAWQAAFDNLRVFES